MRRTIARLSQVPRFRPSLCLALGVFALLLSSCQLHQEIRFSVDGSGTATTTVGMDRDYCTSRPEYCSDRVKWLLGGEGPVANARAAAESLPFDVRVHPAEGLERYETGYELSFDFESVTDLRTKLAPDPTTGESQTSPTEVGEMTFRANEEGGFAFRAEISPSRSISAGWEDSETFAVVVPGEPAEHNADEVEQVAGGTRFQWNFGPGVELSYVERERAGPNWRPPADGGYVLLEASTCSKDSCPPSNPWVAWLVAVLILGAVAALLLGRSRRTGTLAGIETELH